jgi:hypothetical protein
MSQPAQHAMSFTQEGEGNMSAIIPTCTCGWIGSPEYRYNDDQYASAQRQWELHNRIALRRMPALPPN